MNASFNKWHFALAAAALLYAAASVPLGRPSLAASAAASEREVTAAGVVATAPDARPVPDEVARLRDEVSRLSRRLAALELTTASAARADDPVAAPEPSEAEAARADAVAKEERQARLEQRIDTTRDASWSPEFEQELKTLLATEPFRGGRVREVKCGLDLCRVESEHDDVDTQEAFGGALAFSEAARGGGWSRTFATDDGDIRTVTFIARKGVQTALD